MPRKETRANSHRWLTSPLSSPEDTRQSTRKDKHFALKMSYIFQNTIYETCNFSDRYSFIEKHSQFWQKPGEI